MCRSCSPSISVVADIRYCVENAYFSMSISKTVLKSDLHFQISLKSIQSSRVPERSNQTTIDHLSLCPHTVAINLEASTVTYDPADMWQPCPLDSELETWTAARAGRPHFGRLVRAACGEPPSPEHRISKEQHKPRFFSGIRKRTGSFYGCESLDEGQNGEFRNRNSA